MLLCLQHRACQTGSFLSLEPFHPTAPPLQWTTCFFCRDHVDGTVPRAPEHRKLS